MQIFDTTATEWLVYGFWDSRTQGGVSSILRSVWINVHKRRRYRAKYTAQKQILYRRTYRLEIAMLVVKVSRSPYAGNMRQVLTLLTAPKAITNDDDNDN